KIHAGNYTACRRLLSKCASFEANGGPVLLAGPGTGQVPPGLNAPARQSDGSFALHFNGAAGQRYQVFTSTNLVTWDLWKDVIAEDESMEFVVPNAASEPMRFFKLVTP